MKCVIVTLAFIAVWVSPILGQDPDRSSAVKRLKQAGAEVIFQDAKPIRVTFHKHNATQKLLLDVVSLGELVSLDVSGSSISDGDVRLLLGMRLSQLNLSNTQFGDSGMQTVGQMAELQLLNISNTNVSDKGIASLRGLPLMGDLHLQGTNVSDHGLEALPTMQSLWRLSLGGPHISEAGLSHIISLPKLSSVAIEGVRVSPKTLGLLGKMQSLRHLALTGARLETSAIEEFKRAHPNVRLVVRTTQLDSTEIDGIVAQLRKLGAKVELKDGRPIRIKFSGDVSHIGDDDVAIVGQLSTLESLTLSGTGVTDAFLSKLTKLNRLKSLHLYKTKVTWPGIGELEDALPRLNVYATTPHEPQSGWMKGVLYVIIPGFLLVFGAFGNLFVRFVGFGKSIRQAALQGGSAQDTDFRDASLRNAICLVVQSMGALFFCLGGAFLIEGLSQSSIANASGEWPTTDGVVTYSRVLKRSSDDDDGGYIYTPVVVYDYQLAGNNYTAHRIAFHKLKGDAARSAAERFPKGEKVKVAYNPDDALETVLEPGAGPGNLIQTVLGGLFVFIGAAMIFAGYLKRSVRSTRSFI